jgi:hypothetical protein
MGFFDLLFRRSTDPGEAIRRFEEEIRIQRDQLFGMTLFSQGIEMMYAGQPEILEINRQSIQNIKARVESFISEADRLLQEGKTKPEKVREIKRFRFPPISGNPMLDQMTQRAQILVQTYERMFPGRPRSEPLSQDELQSLMMEAADQL